MEDYKPRVTVNPNGSRTVSSTELVNHLKDTGVFNRYRRTLKPMPDQKDTPAYCTLTFDMYQYVYADLKELGLLTGRSMIDVLRLSFGASKTFMEEELKGNGMAIVNSDDEVIKVLVTQEDS